VIGNSRCAETSRFPHAFTFAPNAPMAVLSEPGVTEMLLPITDAGLRSRPSVVAGFDYTF
jgi:hypothetical protein